MHTSFHNFWHFLPKKDGWQALLGFDMLNITQENKLKCHLNKKVAESID